ncbi:MAG: leucine-rich repeat protein [Clostridia bacterium]|nr:leucine-rich repeat protein [Clostridia bacterium]
MSSITKKIEYSELKNSEYAQLFKYTDGTTVIGIIEYENGDVYMGEIRPNEKFDDKRDRRRHGYGKVISKRGKTVESEWHSGLTVGKSVAFDKKGQRTVEIRGGDPSFRTVLYSYLLTEDGKYGGDKYNGLYKDKYWKGDFEDVLRRGELREQLLSGNTPANTAQPLQKSAPAKEKAPEQKGALPKVPAPKAEIKYIEYENGSYEGEIVDGQFHGYGVYRWSNGASYEGEWKNGNFRGHGVYRWADGDVYDGEWKDDKRHGNGKWIYADGSYFTGVWENGDNISASETVNPPVDSADDDLYDESEAYEEADDGFETMTDYYTACMDPGDDLADIFDAPSTHDLISLDSAVAHIVPFFNQVLFCFEEHEIDSATEFLAEILQVSTSALSETFLEDGMFEKDSIDTFDVCACALKCAFLNYVEYQNERTYLATLHFAYFLHKTYSELNGYRCSGLLSYYLALYISYGVLQNDQAKDMGALLLARLCEYGTEYVKLDENSKFYELEERYGERFAKYLNDSEKGLTVNLNGALIDEEADIIFHRVDDSFVVKSGYGSYELEDGSDFVGYIDESGRAYGWGQKFGPNDHLTLGFWKDGSLDGFAIRYNGAHIYAGNHADGHLNGLGLFYNIFCGLDYPIEGIYFRNGESENNPDFGVGQRGSEGRYSSTMRYFGTLDSSGYAHGWCCLWTDADDPKYYGEGIYEHGELRRGMRAWLRGAESVEWAYGSYIRNNDRTGYLLNTTEAYPIGQKGRFTIDDYKKITLEYYDSGEFKNNYLNGKGRRIFSDGLSISGYFINGGIARIEKVILPSGEEANPKDYSHYLSKKHSCEIIWERISKMKTEEKNAFFAECPILIVPKGVKKIPDYMFYKCDALKGIYFNEDLEEIGKDAFAWCKNLGPVLKIPHGVKRIGPSAFAVCSGIKTIYLPNYITVGEWGFMCGVNHVVFETDPPRGVVLDKGAFSECDITMSKEMIKKIKDINRKAFR